MDRKRLKCPRSAAVIVENDDLLMEIIIRLPAKHLVRFQLVSKQWRSLISARFFSDRHTRYHCNHRRPQTSFILRSFSLFFYFNPTSRIFVPFSFISPYTRILRSSHGLMLLECRNCMYGRKYYYVHNPTTRQSRKLTIDGGDKTKPASISPLFLAFDPLKSPHYKVAFLRIIYNRLPKHSLDVYDSESHTWKRILVPFISGIEIPFWKGIYWNNRVYWVRPGDTSYYMDLEKLIFGTIKIPSKNSGLFNKNYLMESNGRFHCISIYLRPRTKYLLVFELLEDNSGWSEKFRVNLSPISYAWPEMKGRVNVLGIVRGNREEDSSVLLNVAGKIVLYRFFYCSFEVLIDFKTNRICTGRHVQFGRNDAYKYMESLAPV